MMALCRDRLVVAFDVPGLGRSDPPPSPITLAECAGIFSEGLESLGIAEHGPIDLFGIHTGTYLACEMAIQNPRQIGSLVLSGIPMRTQIECRDNLKKAKEALVIAEDGSDVFRWLNWLWAFTVRERLPDVDLETAIETFADKASSLPRRSWIYLDVWSYDARGRLPNVRQPVFVLQPDEALLEASRAASSLFPDATFIELPHLTRDILSCGANELADEIRRVIH